jgi:type I restriction enzyme S subunit
MVKEGYKEVRIGPKTKLIPEEWKVKKLKNIIKKRKGKRPNKLFESKDGENFIPYLSVNYLRGNDLPEWCLKNDDNKVEVKENEILMIWDGSYSGNVFIGFNGALSSTMARLKCEDDINNQYLFYQLRNNFKIFQSTTIGTSVPHVAGKVFENLIIPTPEKKEQKKIASILSSVDKSIEKTNEVIEETKELKKGLMQEFLTKGIGHSEFKEVRLNTKKVSIPLTWEVKKLEELVKIKNGYSPRKFDFFEDGEYPFIKVNDMNFAYKYISKANLYFNESKYDLAQPNTIIFPKRGAAISTNKINILSKKAYYDTNVMGLITNDKLVNEYLYYYIQNLGLWQFADTTSIPQINNKHIYPLLVPYPPLEEQNKIASILSSVDAKIKKEEEYKDKLERLKKGLMQKLLTGEIRVNTDMEV